MRIGFFGGSFDPVHFGHLTTVEAAARHLKLDRVLYVPARLSPFKAAAPADARHRVAMLALALEGKPDRAIALDELDREPPSYTVDTLRALSARHLQAQWWLLMGTDTLAELARWRRPEEILGLAKIGAFLREPFAGAGLKVPGIPGLAEHLDVFDAGSVKISASDLRERISRGEHVEGLVPGSVAEYITKHGLYRAGTEKR